MRVSKLVSIFLGCTVAVPAFAQTPARGGASAAPQLSANLLQLMRGILYPSSNIVFFVQDKDPTGVKPEGDPSTAVNPLASSYGGWTAVENAGLAIAEAANLLTIAGRKCANGRPVPIQNADWPKFVQGLREAGMTVYKAAQSKNQDKMLEAADVMSTACANCHDKYREKPNLAARCQ
jgi:hypothetical protein